VPEPRNLTRPQACSYPEGWTFSELRASDGWPLRRYDWPQPEGAARRGLILFFAGRGDMPEKYLETLRHWHAQGWAISGFDWRGQGGSGRLLANPHIGHIARFDQWMDDLEPFMAEMRASETGPVVAIGHSMGGHILMRALAEGRIAPDAAVLSAPMLGFDTGPLPIERVAALVGWAARHWGERKAWPGNEKPSLFASRQKMLTHDDARYADELWWQAQKPELVLGPPSLNWLAEAYASCMAIEAATLESLTVPLLIAATQGDRLVSPAAIRRVAARIPGAQLVMLELDDFGLNHHRHCERSAAIQTGDRWTGLPRRCAPRNDDSIKCRPVVEQRAAHEILREVDAVRTPLLNRIDAFLVGVKRRS